MVIDMEIPGCFWPFAIETTVHVLNRLVRKERLDGLTPIEVFSKALGILAHDTLLKHLRVWGCRAFVHIPFERRLKLTKMAPRAVEGRLIGYRGSHIYKVWFPETGKIVESRDVTFIEDDQPDNDSPMTAQPPPKPTDDDGPSGGAVHIEIPREKSQIQQMKDSGVNTTDNNRELEPQPEPFTTGRVQTLSPSPPTSLAPQRLEPLQIEAVDQEEESVDEYITRINWGINEKRSQVERQLEELQQSWQQP
jgi:hypothetical protein